MTRLTSILTTSVLNIHLGLACHAVLGQVTQPPRLTRGELIHAPLDRLTHRQPLILRHVAQRLSRPAVTVGHRRITLTHDGAGSLRSYIHVRGAASFVSLWLGGFQMFQAVVQVDGGGRDGQGGIPFGNGGCDPRRDRIITPPLLRDGRLMEGRVLVQSRVYPASMTVHTTVAVLPPKFSVAKRRAPSTW